jgi:hypothetical protein
LLPSHAAAAAAAGGTKCAKVPSGSQCRWPVHLCALGVSASKCLLASAAAAAVCCCCCTDDSSGAYRCIDAHTR